VKNYLTFRQLDSALVHKAGLNENDIVPNLRIAYINNKLMKIYRLLDGLNDPWYHKQSLAVTAGSDIVEVKVNRAGQSSSTVLCTATGMIITATQPWKLGEIFVLCRSEWDHDASPTPQNTSKAFVGRVTAIDNTAPYYTCTFEVIGGTTPGAADYLWDTVGSGYYTAFDLIKIQSPSTLIISLASLYVKDILRIWDNAYTGGKNRIFTEIKDPQIFSNLHRDPFFDKQVAWFQRGESVELYVGTTATALGTINIEYRGKPTPCTDFDTDVYIDIPPEENQVLMDEVYAEYLTHMKIEIPSEVQARQAEFSKRYESAMADVQRRETMVHGKRGG